MTVRRLAALAIPALLGGCYTYAPIDAGSVHPGGGVRATVAPAAAARIAPLLGATDATVLTGTVIDNAGGSLVIEVPTVVQTGIGGSLQSLNQRISITPADLIHLETRKLDRGRTALVVGAVAFIGGSAAIAALRGGPTSDAPPTTSGSESRIPVFRLHF